MNRLKKGDDVIVIAGKDKGRRGTILKMLADDRVLVENVNMIKKHTRPNPNKGETGGIVEREAPLQASNVMLYNPTTEKGDRVGFRLLSDGRKVRFFKGNGEELDT